MGFHPLAAKLNLALDACQIYRQPYKRTVYRIVKKDKWANNADLISGDRAASQGGRWNAVGRNIKTVYTSELIKTAVSERLYYAMKIAAGDAIRKKLKTRGPILPKNYWDQYVLGTVEVDLDILNMTNPAVLAEIQKVKPDFGRATMLAEWERESKRGETLVQAIGAAAMQRGVCAILVPSARDNGFYNAVFFPTNISATGFFRTVSIAPLPEDHRRLL